MKMLQNEYKYKRSKRDSRHVNIFEGAYKINVHNVSEFWGFAVIFAVLLLAMLTNYNLYDNLPRELDNSVLLHYPQAFIAERAYKDLKILTSFGPRFTGSYSNEILAVDFLKREIRHIKQTANKNQRIELDVQIVSGAFWNNFKPHGMVSYYRNVQNVVVKLHGEKHLQHQSNNSILLNCHFDSVPGSPGASDDAANCVVMLEILRVLSRYNDRTKHSIIFLFNGAEETGLMASHGFITQHKWAKDVKAFVNLESAGSDGKELLFQSSPNNSWMIKLYGNSVPHPFAQVAAEEIFESGLIPSDTDFRIFRRFGNIPGIDFAYISNGYRYHTKYDNINYISRKSLQHTGNNMLELTKALANCYELEYNDGNEIDTGSQVYYDLFGYFLISYTQDFSIIMNYIIVTLAVLIPYILLSQATKGINKKHLRYEIFLGFLIDMISLVTSNAFCYAIAYDLDLMDKSMTWYSNTFICVPTYCLVTVFVQCVAHLIFNRNSKAPISLALQTQARLIGTSFFWSILAAALTGAGIRSAYAIIVPLLITLISNIIIGLLSYQNSVRNWLYIHLAGQVLVVLWATNLYHMVLGVFIPIAGRAGGTKNPDIIIAIVCSSLTFFTTSYLCPLVILFRKFKNFLITMFAVYIIARFYLITFTRYGFPYTDENNDIAPKVQRHLITHTIRTLYDKEGKIRYTDSGFWMMELDRNARKTIEALIMPEEAIPQEENILCKTEVFCGLPLMSVRQLMVSGYWIPGPAPLIREEGHLKLVQHQKPDTKSHHLHFLLSGSYKLSLQIHLKDSVKLEKWNLTPELPELTVYNKQSSYFVMISHGLEAEPLNVTLDLKTSDEDHKRSLIDITLVTYHWEYQKDHTSIFTNMLNKLPRWAYAVSAVASYRTWTF